MARWSKVLRDLVDEFGGGDVTLTAGGHYALKLSGSERTVFTSGTPGDWRVLHNTRAKLRRAAKERTCSEDSSGTAPSIGARTSRRAS